MAEIDKITTIGNIAGIDKMVNIDKLVQQKSYMIDHLLLLIWRTNDSLRNNLSSETSGAQTTHSETSCAQTLNAQMTCSL